MLHRLESIGRNQKGFTLIELLVAIAIAGLISGGITMSIFQVFSVNASSTAHMTAIKQVESALHFMVRDIQMAQTIQTDNLSGDERLKLTWVEWDNTTHQVTYTLSDGNLVRTYLLNDQTTVAHCVASLNVTPYTDGKVLVTITSTIGGARPASETRVVEILPRSGS